MKKFTKTVLVIAAVFAVIGIGCCVSALVMGVTVSEAKQALTNEYGEEAKEKYRRVERMLGGDDYTESDEEENTVGIGRHTFGEIRNINVEFVSGELHLLPAEDNQVTVNIKAQQTGNETTVYADGSFGLSLENEYTNSGCVVEIYVPENLKMDSVEIHMDAGIVKAAALNTEYLDVEIGTGEFKGSGKLLAEESEWELGAGEIKVNDLKCKNAEFTCDLGSIKASIDGSEKDYDREISCDRGSVSIGGKHYDAMSDDEYVTAENAVGTIQAECEEGSIEIAFKENK